MRAWVLLAVAAVLVGSPPAVADDQGNCTALDVREHSNVGLTLRPDIDEYRAELVLRQTACGPLPGVGQQNACNSGSQVTFRAGVPSGLRGNVSPERVSMVSSGAVSELRVSANLTAPGQRLTVPVEARCAGSTRSVGLTFRVGELWRVSGRSLGVTLAPDSTTWRVLVENKGNAAATVEMHGFPAANATNQVEWTVPDAFTVPSRFDRGAGTVNRTEVEVTVRALDLGQPFSVFLRASNERAPGSFLDAVEVPLQTLSFRGESPGAGLVWLVAAAALVLFVRR